MADTPIVLEDPELIMLKNNKQSGFNYRQRRDDDWLENYTLYRDRVIYNRLTQRQSVNIPLMKTQIRTLLVDVDDMPVIEFENLDNDKDAEIFQNEYWKWTVERNKMDLKDIVDKRQVFLFGRTFDQMQIVDGMVKFSIIDPQDILVDRYLDPTDLDSSRFLIHTHIYVPLSELKSNKSYDQQAVADLEQWFSSTQGVVKDATNARMVADRNAKMTEMGVPDVDNPVLGETIVELSLHFNYHKEEGDEEEELYLYVEAENYRTLLKDKLENVIGVTADHYWRNHYPYNTWADDVEVQDFWSDGIADIIRVPNKVLNTWFAQMVENRTLRNFGMNYYDSTLEGFAPQSYEPKPFAWIPIPVPTGSDINKIVQRIDIPDLADSLPEMNFMIQMSEKATGATTTQQGAQNETQVTLGEVQLALGQAQQRIKGMAKFYIPAWKSRGEKFLKLIEAAPDKLDAVKLYKKGRNSSDIYPMEVSPDNWMTKSGYSTKVWSQDEKNTEDTNALQKINAALAMMPDNPVLREVSQKRLLNFAELTPDEIKQAMEYEKQKAALPQPPMIPGQGGPLNPGAPGQGNVPPPQIPIQKPVG